MFKVLPTEDDRNHVATESKGVYMVYKKNCVAQFSFPDQLDNAELALLAANGYVQSRKDKNLLKIVYIPRYNS
jgi:hypothetical protein